MPKSSAEDPDADIQEMATIRFLKGRIPPGSRVAAPARFADALGTLTPPAAVGLPDWAVVETGGPEATPLPMVRQLLAQSTPVHANARYVVFARRPTFGLTDQRDTPEVQALAARAATAGEATVVPPLPSLVPSRAETGLTAQPATELTARPELSPRAPVTRAVTPSPKKSLRVEPSLPLTPSRPPATIPELRSPLPPAFWRQPSRPASPVPRAVPAPTVPLGTPAPLRPILPPEALAAARGARHRPGLPVPSAASPVPFPGAEHIAPQTTEPVSRPLDTSPAPLITAPSLPTAVPPWAPGTAPLPTGLPGRVLSLIGGTPVRSVATFGEAASLAEAFPPSVVVAPAGAEDVEQAVQLVLIVDPDAESLPDILTRAARLLRHDGLAVIVAENADSLGRHLARALGREGGGGLTAARLRGAVRAAGFTPGLMEGFSLDPWRATADALPEALATGPAADLLEIAGRDAGPDHAARLLLLARLT